MDKAYLPGMCVLAASNSINHSAPAGHVCACVQGLTFMTGEMGIPMDNIAVLSIGTGTAVADLRKGVLKEGRRGWGMLEWILPNQGNIVTTIMDGTAEAGQAIVEVLFRVRKTLARHVSTC